MKNVLIGSLILLLGCAQTVKPQTQKINFDFSQIKILYQPPAPPYPPEAKASGIQGVVIVRLTIDTNGIPISAEAIDGPIELRSTAESYALQWKFGPAFLNGVPQKASFNLTMPFKLKTPPQQK